ncbi:MAG: hypothetical protein QF815_01475, partial [Candidatus Peribacteraceae bacterium]|nr:hypothetical protein [Candidatus Peribacteraceae bacterium]
NGYRTRRFFDFNYRDMPEGFTFTFANKRYDIPEGDGRIRVSSLPGGRRTHDLYVYDAEGERVTRLAQIKISGRHIDRRGTFNTGKALEDYSHIPSLPEHLQVSAEQKAQATLDLASSGLAHSEAEKEMYRLELEQQEITEQMNAIEREKIPYSQLHVSPNENLKGVFDVRYASNQEQTYFEVTLAGEPGPIFRETLEHPQGETDGLTSFDIRGKQGSRGDGQVIISMYTDDSRSELLDRFAGGTMRRLGGTVQGETNGQWGDVEEGRTVENPYEPTLAIVQMQGPNIVVAFQSPFDSSKLELDGGGYFDTQSVDHNGGIELSTHLLTFNTDNPAGNYELRLFEGRNNEVVASQGFGWDPENETFAMNYEGSTITVSANSELKDGLNALNRQIYMQNTLGSMEIMIPSLSDVQGTHMYERSEFYIDPDNDQMYVDNSAVAGQPDAGGIFRQLLGAYEGAMKDLLQCAGKIAVAAWSGESQSDAEAKLRTAYDVTIGLRYLTEFASDFGVSLPPVEKILDEGMRLANEMVSELHTQQAKQESMRAREIRRADQPGPAGTERSQAAINAQLNSIRESFGSDVAGYTQVASNYVNALSGNARNHAVAVVEGTGVIIAAPDNGTFGGGVVFIDEGMQVGSEVSVEIVETPTSENTLIILIYGSNQFPGETVGFENLALQLKDYSNVLTISPGHNPFDEDPNLGQEEAFFEVQNEIAQAIEQNPQIENIVLSGYSWGGGMVYDTAEWLQSHEEFKSKEIVAAAYVDAVSLNNFTAENRIPPGVQNMINIYQSDATLFADGPFLLNGGRINNSDSLATFQEIDMDEFDNFQKHSSIDEASVPFIEGFIRSIIQVKK